MITVRKGFKFRIYPTPKQVERMLAWEDALRWLWNLANEQRLLGLARPKGERRYYTAFDQIYELKGLRAELPWLKDVPHDVSAQLLTQLDLAWTRCFKRLARAPRWKKKGRDVISLCESQPYKGGRINSDVLRFPKIGNIRVIAHRPLEGKFKTCTIKRDGDQWFASVLCEVTIADPIPRTGACCGA